MQTPIYLQLAAKLAAMINKGTYPPGEKLPSLRKIHQEQGISIGTVLQAFQHLQDIGLIVSREKSGYFVNHKPAHTLPVPQIIPSSLSEQTIHIDTLLRKLKKPSSGNNFVSFSTALPDHRLLPFNTIKRVIQQISRDASGSYLELEDAKGYQPLREAIARRSLAWGAALHTDDVIITNGATEALNLCLKAVTKPGDTVLIQEPCFYGVMQCLEFLDLKAVTIPCYSGTGIEVGDLQTACEKYTIKACLLVSNFNNPTGATLSSDKKRSLAVFANKNKLPIIEDDLYGDLYHEGSRPDNIKTYDKNGWVQLCNSFSKSLFPGARLGWCAPGRWSYEVARYKSMSTAGTNSLLQKVLYELLHTGAYDRHLQRFRQQLYANMVRTSRLIERHFPEGTKLTRPGGGVVLWIELPRRINAAHLQDVAFEQGVGIAPGEIFSAKAGYKNYIRISYCTTWNLKTEKALEKLGRICKSI
ncbi:MAG: PLP-dependent aminotransferase family protein [Chitinophagaceae bacterium]|nr:PLP-dependent aminotransferase family protein [Chitinophagaceae bacterium]